MTSEKQLLRRVNSAHTGQSSSPVDTTHNVFLHLRLEPFLSSSLLDLIDILAYPISISPSVPSTPPPLYEPPPPSYPAGESWLAPLSDEQSPAYDSTNDVQMTPGDVVVEEQLQNELALNLLMYEVLAHQSDESTPPGNGSSAQQQPSSGNLHPAV
ncbi:hypothetical protein DL89DRAFT_285067 [Linderina pennispora]|uniref:Uncharacterized protein n=1 Tax=Linderina pennispora TaxID=61395 RepID=A0A1Y1W4I9_9FUNG|nr:uncharacterized protein DL89DRAFT_285067 [Linderina pennispora]ORX68302.1 hypothetical protein DL89DRAFT_285067 [Linderina pennispora]